MPTLSALPVGVRWILAGSAAVWLALELRQSSRHRPEGVKAGWRSEIVFRLAVAAGALVAVALAHGAKAPAIRPAAGAAWLGVVLFWSGAALRIWSFRTLGRYFTFVVQTSKDQPVIDAGPYRVIRHPSYAGVILYVTAAGLFTGNWLSLVALVVAVTAGLAYRIHVEERALLRGVGDEYRAYSASTKRLVPYVW